MAECMKGRIVHIYSKKRNDNDDGGYWFACQVKYKNKIHKLAGSIDTCPVVGYLVEGPVALDVGGKYGDQYKTVESLTCHFADKESFVTYFGAGFCSSITRSKANRLWDDWGEDIWDALIKTPKDVKVKSGLSDTQLDHLTYLANTRHIVAYLMHAFPSLSSRAAKAIVSKIPLKAQAIKELILEDPYSMIHINGVTIYDMDKVYLNDLFGSLSDKMRMYYLLYTAVLKFMKSYGATYVNLSDLDQCYRLAKDNIYTEGSLMYMILTRSRLPVAASFTIQEFSRLLSEFQKWDQKSDLVFVRTKVERNGRSVPEIHLYVKDIWMSKQRIERILMEQSVIGCVSNSHYSKRADTIKGYLYENIKNGVLSLNQEQQEAIYTVFSNKISVISGGPGRGKTHVLSQLIPIWESFFGKGSVMCLGSTGRSVKRMRDMLNRDTMQTASRLLVTNGSDFTRFDDVIREADELNYGKGPHFSKFKVTRDSLIVVDESSMIDFVTAANLMGLCKKATLVFIGDVDQLPPISLGDFLKELIDSDAVPVTYLKQNMRADVPELVTYADDIVAGTFSVKSARFSNSFWFDPIIKNDMATQKAVIKCHSDLMGNGADFDDILVVTPVHKSYAGTDLLNVGFRESLNFKRDADLIKGVFFNRKCLFAVNKGGECLGFQISIKDPSGQSKLTNVRIGDRVMNKENNLKMELYEFEHDDPNLEGHVIGTGIYNGDTGRIVRYVIDNENDIAWLLIRMDDGSYVYINEMDFGGWELGYVLTVHKSQGSEAKHVIVVLPTVKFQYGSPLNPFYIRNLLYVACSRAKESVTFIGDVDMLNLCMNTPVQYFNRTPFVV